MDEKEKGLVIDWLHEIADNPAEWEQYYSETETKLLAEKAIELLR